MATKRSYGDACRFAHALDLVGERWALLVVRELLLGPKRFTDLRGGLPKASTNILAERLRELELGGVVRKRRLPPPAATSVYELTEWGRELEPIVTRLGAWGARSPFPPDVETIGADSIVLALRSLFDPEAAGEMIATYELRLGEDLFHVDIGDWEIELDRGAAEAPDAAIETDPRTLAAVLTGQLPLDEALESGAVAIEGGKRAVSRFLKLFPTPEQCPVAGAEKSEAGPGMNAKLSRSKSGSSSSGELVGL
jgi:DNA-binding HxlR family transcriptional regulator/putative sterol carrier protein